MSIIPLRKPEREPEYVKVHVIKSSGSEYGDERHYCQMCKFLSKESLMKYNKGTKIWQCWRCGYTINPSLGQTPKTEDTPTIENDSANTKPIVIPLKNFNAAYNSTLEEEESSIRPRIKKYQSAREAWEDDSI